jgi:hypothetical protein
VVVDGSTVRKRLEAGMLEKIILDLLSLKNSAALGKGRTVRVFIPSDLLKGHITTLIRSFDHLG